MNSFLLISIINSGGDDDEGDEMEHQSDNAQHIEGASTDDSFEIFKPKILMAIDKMKGKKKRADIDATYHYIVQPGVANINKSTIKDFVTQLVAQKLVMKKNTSQGNESYHKTSTDEDLLQPPRHSIRTPAKEDFYKTEVESGTQIDFIYNKIYVKSDVFDVFYKDYLAYKGYISDILNTLIPNGDILHRIEKNTTEHSKKIE